jgi:hypothetical protein
MKKISLFLILLTLSLGSFVHADELSNLDNSSYEYNAIAFQKTVALCSAAYTVEQKVDVNVGMLKFFFKGVGGGFLFLGQDGTNVTAYTRNLISSQGFKAALYKCFPESQFYRRAFLGTIILDEILGHGVGFGLWLVPIAKFAAMLKISLSLPSLVSKALAAGLVGYASWKGYSLYRGSHNRNQQIDKINDEMVDSSEVGKDSSLKLLYDMLADTNAQLAANPDAVTKTKLTAKKTYLEGRIYFESHRSGEVASRP